MRRAFTLGLVLGLTLLLTLSLGRDGRGPRDAAPPVITLKLWDYNWPVEVPGHGNYLGWLLAALAEFEGEHPGVTVDYQLLSWKEGPRQVDETMGEGDLPDVYSGPLDLSPGDRLVPLGTYLRREDLASYDAHLLALASRDRKPAALPRWAELITWVGNPELLRGAGLDPRQAQREGWTWEQVRRLARSYGRPSWAFGKLFALGSTSPVLLFEDLLGAASGQGLFTGDDRLRSQEPVWREAAALLAELAAAGATAPLDREHGGLEAFFRGQTAVLGRAGPWLADLAVRRGKRPEESGIAAVLLPVPTPRPGPSPALGRLTALHVFRQAADQRRERLRQAVQLARYLAEHSGEVAARLTAVPAYLPARVPWSTGLALDADQQRFLTDLAGRLAVTPQPPWPEAARQQEFRLDVLGPLARGVWAGWLGPAEFSAAATARYHGSRARQQ